MSSTLTDRIAGALASKMAVATYGVDIAQLDPELRAALVESASTSARVASEAAARWMSSGAARETIIRGVLTTDDPAAEPIVLQNSTLNALTQSIAAEVAAAART